MILLKNLAKAKLSKLVNKELDRNILFLFLLEIIHNYYFKITKLLKFIKNSFLYISRLQNPVI